MNAELYESATYRILIQCLQRYIAHRNAQVLAELDAKDGRWSSEDSARLDAADAAFKKEGLRTGVGDGNRP